MARKKASPQPAENAPEDPRITSLRARLAALKHHRADDSGVIRNATPLGKVDG